MMYNRRIHEIVTMQVLVLAYRLFEVLGANFVYL